MTRFEAMALHFELVTPERLVLSEDVYMVVVPGTKASSVCLKAMRRSCRPSKTGGAQGL